MTKQQFQDGLHFKIKGEVDYKGANTYYYENDSICQASRSSIDERVVIEQYHMNIRKIGVSSFTGFTYIMNKKVVIRLKFDDLILY